MTQEEAEALGARLAACPRFRPMPGLRDMQGRTWEQSLLWRWTPSIDRPDIREPATRGIVLELVREAWGDPYVVARWSGQDWRVVWTDNAVSCWTIARGDTEAEALVAALENTP